MCVFFFQLTRRKFIGHFSFCLYVFFTENKPVHSHITSTQTYLLQYLIYENIFSGLTHSINIP